MNPNARGTVWLDTKGAAAYLAMTPKNFYYFLDEERKRQPQRLKIHWIGARMRFRPADLDKCVEEEPTAAAESTPPLQLVRGAR